MTVKELVPLINERYVIYWQPIDGLYYHYNDSESYTSVADQRFQEREIVRIETRHTNWESKLVIFVK